MKVFDKGLGTSLKCSMPISSIGNQKNLAEQHMVGELVATLLILGNLLVIYHSW